MADCDEPSRQLEDIKVSYPERKIVTLYFTRTIHYVCTVLYLVLSYKYSVWLICNWLRAWLSEEFPHVISPTQLVISARVVEVVAGALNFGRSL